MGRPSRASRREAHEWTRGGGGGRASRTDRGGEQGGRSRPLRAGATHQLAHSQRRGGISKALLPASRMAVQGAPTLRGRLQAARTALRAAARCPATWGEPHSSRAHQESDRTATQRPRRRRRELVVAPGRQPRERAFRSLGEAAAPVSWLEYPATTPVQLAQAARRPPTAARSRRRNGSSAHVRTGPASPITAAPVLLHPASDTPTRGLARLPAPARAPTRVALSRRASWYGGDGA